MEQILPRGGRWPGDLYLQTEKEPGMGCHERGVVGQRFFAGANCFELGMVDGLRVRRLSGVNSRLANGEIGVGSGHRASG